MTRASRIGQCSVEGCASAIKARRLCTKHYQRVAKYGTTNLERPSEQERFWAKVDRRGPDECWPWMAAKWGEYGFFNIPPTTIGAHRYAYIDTYGPIPEGLVVDHKCHNPACVNPSHLQAVTTAENNQNHSGPTRANTSGVRGVWWDKIHKRWVAQASLGSRTYSAGHHKTLEEAKAAVLTLRKELHTNNLRDRDECDSRTNH